MSSIKDQFFNYFIHAMPLEILLHTFTVEMDSICKTFLHNQYQLQSNNPRKTREIPLIQNFKTNKQDYRLQQKLPLINMAFYYKICI